MLVTVMHIIYPKISHRDQDNSKKEISEMANSTSIDLQSKMNFLDFDVRYSIQVFAKNIYGRSEGSEVVNFTRNSGKWYK